MGLERDDPTATSLSVSLCYVSLKVRVMSQVPQRGGGNYLCLVLTVSSSDVDRRLRRINRPTKGYTHPVILARWILTYRPWRERCLSARCAARNHSKWASPVCIFTLWKEFPFIPVRTALSTDIFPLFHAECHLCVNLTRFVFLLFSRYE